MFGQNAQGPPSGWMGNVGTGLQVGGLVNSTLATVNANRFNAGIQGQERDSAINQGAAGETAQVRANRARLGTQLAGFGAAGGGYGGSAKAALDQSLVNQEMDALSTKYKGVLTGFGYGVNSQLDSARANSSALSGSLMAGAALLKGAGSNYTFSPTGNS